MHVLGINKNVRGCVILAHTEQLTGAKIFFEPRGLKLPRAFFYSFIWYPRPQV